MNESLHEAAMRFTGSKGCKGGCQDCEVGKIRGENGVCLVRRIAQCSNAEQQIEWLKDWQRKNPPKPRWILSCVIPEMWGSGIIKYQCSECSFEISEQYTEMDSKPFKDYNFCPRCGKLMIGGVQK